MCVQEYAVLHFQFRSKRRFESNKNNETVADGAGKVHLLSIRNAKFLSFERDQRFAVVIGVKKYTAFQTHRTCISNRSACQKTPIAQG